MNSVRQKAANPWPFIVLFFILASVAAVVGLINIRNQKDNLLLSARQELSTIADLKVSQLTQWRNERMNDGEFLGTNTPLVKQLSRFLSDQNNLELRSDLRLAMRSLVDNYDYQNVIFLDSDLKVRLFYPDQDTVIGDYLVSKLPDIVNKGAVMLTDIHNTGKVSFMHLDLIIPLKGPEIIDTTQFGTLVLRINPGEIIYPIIDSWPAKSRTSETLLLRRDGDAIIYLNRLQAEGYSGIHLENPVAGERLLANMAFRGVQETTDAIDYRGIKVLAAIKKVPGFPWYLVAKADQEEVLSTLPERVKLIVMIVVLFIFTTGSFLGFLLWDQRVRFYRGKYQAELDRMAVVRHFDYILKYANDIIFLMDQDYRIIEANDKAIEAYQYERNELIGKNVKELRSVDASASFDEDIEILRNTGYLTFETTHRRKDNNSFPIEISARSVDIEGIRYYQSISRDITERKSSELTLKESEEKFRKIFEDSPICMLMTGKDFGILRANATFCDLLGYSEDELIGMTFKSFTHPDYISDDEVALMRLVAGELAVYHTEKRYINRSGSILWGSTTVNIIRNNTGEVQFFLAMVEDITSRKIVEEKLERSLSVQRATLESTADGILVVDDKGKIVQYNKKFAEMWKIPGDVLNLMEDAAAVNYVLDQLKYPDEFFYKIKSLYADSEAITNDLVEFVDGRFFERYSQPLTIGGKLSGRVWSFRDITEAKKAEADIIAAKEKAEESDRLKTAFLHNVSHEIRTPMNAILGFSALLNESDTSPEERQQYTDIIFQSGNQLLSIINDIVDLASIESGQMKLKPQSVDLNSVLNSISGQFSYREKPQILALGLRTSLPDKEAVIITDKVKLVQILSNLINNAFKFTQTGRIDFGYILREDFLEFFVKDTGIGISPEYHEKIFERFYQVDSATSRHYTGTGLGLSICKAYVELMGGKIWLVSKPGEGTTFVFTIPYLKDESEAPGA